MITLSESVAWRTVDGIAFLEVNNPPVNALSTSVRSGLVAGLRRATTDSAVTAVVILCLGKSFFSGADISEFEGAEPEPTSDTLMELLDAMPKPVIAAIHVRALGGGLELALACHHRIATSDSTFGFPEVSLGIIPGLGGTQRTPRLVGYPLAIEMITTGKPISAAAACSAGLIDAVVEDDLTLAALDFAVARVQRLASTPLKRARDLDEHVTEARRQREMFKPVRKKLEKARSFRQAPLDALRAIECGLDLDFDQALAEERKICAAAYESEEAKALISTFFAERRTKYVPGIARDVAGAAVSSIGILGAGAMGRCIAIACLDADKDVCLVDANATAREASAIYIEKNYLRAVEKGRLSEQVATSRVSRLKIAEDMSAFGSSDLIIEAIYENLDVKKAAFAKLDAVARPGAILASNTSGLDINEIAAATQRPGDVIGLHFFNPAHIMRLVEVVRGHRSSEQAIVTGVEIARKMGKLPIVSGVCPGFIANRVFDHYFRQAEFLVEEGATPEEIDHALEKWGMAMGPFAVVDLSGLDVSHEIRKGYPIGHPEGTAFPALEDELFGAGRLGQKSGQGWYRYPEGGGPRQSDPDVAAIIEEYRQRHGIVARKIGAEEIVTRCIYALINEAANVLSDGTASRATDIDIAAIHGYAFPAQRGGPVFQADWVGIDKVLRQIEEFHDKLGYWWRPSPLLKALSVKGETLSSVGIS